MDLGKKVHDNRQVAKGFFALRDRNGNLIYETAAIDKTRQVVRGQDQMFHPCAAIQNDLASNRIDATMIYAHAAERDQIQPNRVMDVKQVQH